ncbi:3820_t:CDS:2, partial [Racocetra fulgida]
MSSRTSKKHANEKLNTNTANKRGRKKKEMATSLSLNNYDDPLDSADNSKSKKSKKSNTASYEKNDVTVTSRKNKQDKVTSVVDHQTIDNILNSFNDSTETNYDDEDIDYNSDIAETESSQSHIRSSAIISDDFNNTLISAPSRHSVTRAMSIHSDDFISSHEAASRPPISASLKCLTQRARSIFNDDFIPSNRPVFRSLMLASSGSLQTLNSDNSFGPMKAGRDFLEELKCLFLRVRNPHKNAIKELVRQIIKCDINSADENPPTLPKKEEVDKFIDEKKTETVFQRWLNAMKIDELKAENSLFYLCQFIKKAFIVNYNVRNLEKTKTLDIIIKNIVVPSRNGKNSANNLR